MSQETKKIAIILASNDHEKVQLAGMISSVAADGSQLIHL